MTSSAAMENDAVLRRIISLTEAAKRAEMSAESALNQVQIDLYVMEFSRRLASSIQNREGT